MINFELRFFFPLSSISAALHHLFVVVVVYRMGAGTVGCAAAIVGGAVAGYYLVWLCNALPCLALCT